MITTQARLPLLFLVSAALAAAQSATYRPSASTLQLHFDSSIDRIISLRLVILGDPAKTGTVSDLFAKSKIDGQDINSPLTGDQVAAIRQETLAGRTATVLGQVCSKAPDPSKPNAPCSADDRVDINAIVPDGFVILRSTSVRASRTVLTVAALSDECRNAADPPTFWQGKWTASPGVVESVTLNKNSIPPQITVVFVSQPPNGGKIAISYKPDDSAMACTLDVSADNLAAPSPTSTDPTGDADLYVSLGYTRSASASATQNILNTSLFFRYPFHHFSLLGAVGHITPTVTVKAATKPQDDENSIIVTAPVLMQWSKHPSVPWFQALQFSAGPTFETDKKVRSKDVLGDAMFRLLPPNINFGSKAYLRFSGYVGTELGKNITHENAAVSGGAIERFKLGAAAKWIFEVNEAKGQEITISGSYDWRKLFRPESREDDDTLTLGAGTYTSATGEITQIPAGTLTYRNVFSTAEGDRRYLTAAASYSITRNVLASLEYDRGSLPPAFKRVDKLQIGITLLFNAFTTH